MMFRSGSQWNTTFRIITSRVVSCIILSFEFLGMEYGSLEFIVVLDELVLSRSNLSFFIDVFIFYDNDLTFNREYTKEDILGDFLLSVDLVIQETFRITLIQGQNFFLQY